MSIAARDQLTVAALELVGSEQVLEIGCGHGVAVRLALERLTTGQIVALDRSTKMTAAVKQASTEALAEGRLRTIAKSLEDMDWQGPPFDALYAINVDLNRRLGDTWAPLLKTLLKPNGRLVLACDPPPGSLKGDGFSVLSQARLEAAGFEVKARRAEAGITLISARLVPPQ